MWRVLAAAGAAAAVTLGLVGVGVEGAFTSAVEVQGQITAGSFTLVATQLGSGLLSGTTDATSPAPTMDPSGTGQDVLKLQLDNALPGATYYDEFDVQDAGTVPGTLTAVSFAPSGGPSLPGTTVALRYDLNGVWANAGQPSSAAAPATFALGSSPLLDPSGAVSVANGVSAVMFMLLVHLGSSASSVQIDLQGYGQASSACGPPGASHGSNASLPLTQGSGRTGQGSSTSPGKGSPGQAGGPGEGAATGQGESAGQGGGAGAGQGSGLTSSQGGAPADGTPQGGPLTNGAPGTSSQGGTQGSGTQGSGTPGSGSSQGGMPQRGAPQGGTTTGGSGPGGRTSPGGTQADDAWP